jgi:hypothetical protein
MSKNLSELEKKAWLHTKARGKKRFIRGEVLQSILTGLIVIAGTELLGSRSQPFSLRTTVVVGLILLPICALGGLLSGNWRWQDFEKKFPE